MNSSVWIEFALPIATALIGWFTSAYRTKQKKEKDTLDNVQQILDIQKSYIADQQNELRGMRANNRKISDILEAKNRSIRKANKCKFTNEGEGCPVLHSEEENDKACETCHLNTNIANDKDKDSD